MALILFNFEEIEKIFITNVNFGHKIGCTKNWINRNKKII